MYTVHKILIGSLIILCILGFVAEIINVKDSTDKAHTCSQRGGVPITERGVYKACAKPDAYIILEESK